MGYHSKLLVAYNTGNPYTVDGQRIAIFLLTRDEPEHERIAKVFLMVDFDRGISYLIEYREFGEGQAKDLMDYVHWCYDYDCGHALDTAFTMYGREVARVSPKELIFQHYRPQAFFGAIDKYGQIRYAILREEPVVDMGQQYTDDLKALVKAARGLVDHTDKLGTVVVGRTVEFVETLRSALEQFEPHMESEDPRDMGWVDDRGRP